MANKQKKKRNKVYRGAEAAIDRPIITRVTAVNRSRVGQWWYDHKRFTKPVLVASGVVAFIGLIVAAIIQLAT